MKTVIVSVILLCIMSQGQAQVRARISDDQLFYLKKAEKYRRMKSTGMTLAIAGTGLIVGGIVTIVNADTHVNSYGQKVAADDKIRNGAIAYLLGVGCVGAGTPLWIVGGINQNRYNKKLDQNVFGMRVSPEHGGVTLSYRF